MHAIHDRDALARAQREAARLRTAAAALEVAVAAYYFDHRHDPDEAGCEAFALAAPMEGGDRRIGVTLTAHFAPDDAAALRRCAEARGVGYAEALRDLVRAADAPRAVVTLAGPHPPITRGTSVVYRYTDGD